MAEANQGIRDLTTERVQSILEGESDNDSQCLLPQVPDTTIDGTGLSSMRQNLSSSFNCLCRGIASRMDWSTNQQNPINIDVDANQLSPNSLRSQLAAYQNTVRDLYNQNQRNAEALGWLKSVVTDKDSEISRLHILETEKDLRIEAQQRDFQSQLIAKQNVWQEVSNTVEVLHRELEAFRAEQNSQNQMDVSLSTDATTKLNHIKQKANEEKCLVEERLAKAKADHEQALRDKNREITVKVKRIKK